MSSCCTWLRSYGPLCAVFQCFRPKSPTVGSRVTVEAALESSCQDQSNGASFVELRPAVRELWILVLILPLVSMQVPNRASQAGKRGSVGQDSTGRIHRCLVRPAAVYGRGVMGDCVDSRTWSILASEPVVAGWQTRQRWNRLGGANLSVISDVGVIALGFKICGFFAINSEPLMSE